MGVSQAAVSKEPKRDGDSDGRLRDGFGKRAEMPGMTPEDPESLIKSASHLTLQKFAIDDSDAIVFGNEKTNPELEE